MNYELRITKLKDFDTDDCMDAGGTTPRMGEVESSLEQRPRVTQEAKAENTDIIFNDQFYMDEYEDII